MTHDKKQRKPFRPSTAKERETLLRALVENPKAEVKEVAERLGRSDGIIYGMIHRAYPDMSSPVVIAAMRKGWLTMEEVIQQVEASTSRNKIENDDLSKKTMKDRVAYLEATLNDALARIDALEQIATSPTIFDL